MAPKSKMLLVFAFAFVCICLQSASGQQADTQANPPTALFPGLPATCPYLDAAGRQKTAMECVQSDPDLAKLLAMMMSDQSQSLADQEAKVCQNMDAVAKGLNCMMEKANELCSPSSDFVDVKSALRTLIPAPAKVMQALKLVCDNRDKFTQENIQCLESVEGKIAQCTSQALQERPVFIPGFESAIRSATCRAVNSTYSCTNLHLGDCNRDMMNVLVQGIDILNPCDGSESIPTTLDFLQSILTISNALLDRVSTLMPDTCPFKDPTERQGAAMECVLASPGASITVSRYLTGQSNDSVQGLVENLCQQTGDFASVSDCLVNKAKPCLPPNIAGIPRQPLIDLLPKDERFHKAFDHICKNRDKLSLGNLMCFQNPQGDDELTPCFNRKIRSKVADVDPNDEDSLKDAVCSGMYGVNDCLKASPGTCDDDTLKAVTDLVNIFNPCNGAANNGMAILLLAAVVLLSLFNNKMF